MSGYRLDVELRWGGQYAPGTQWALTARDPETATVLRSLPWLRRDGCPVEGRASEVPCLYLPSGTPEATAGHVVALVLRAATGTSATAGSLLMAMVADAWKTWGQERCGAEHPEGGACRQARAHHDKEFHETRRPVLWPVAKSEVDHG